MNTTPLFGARLCMTGAKQHMFVLEDADKQALGVQQEQLAVELYAPGDKIEFSIIPQPAAAPAKWLTLPQFAEQFGKTTEEIKTLVLSWAHDPQNPLNDKDVDRNRIQAGLEAAIAAAQSE